MVQLKDVPLGVKKKNKAKHLDPLFCQNRHLPA